MHVAAYSPSKETADLLLQLFDSYQKLNGTVFSYRYYGNPVDLLCDFTPGEYDALFFTGEHSDSMIAEIRQKDQQIRLIGIVRFGQNTVGAVRDLWYCLPEPLESLFLFPLLDRLMAELSRKDETGMVIKTKGSVMHLVFSQIEYVEVIGRSIQFHLVGGRTEEISGTFSDYEARLLQWPDFIKVHRAYIVNLRHISKLTAEGVLTGSSCFVPVSRNLYPQLKKDYLASLLLPEAEYTEAPSSPPPSDDKRPYVILLVDDEEAERTRWSSVLSEHGCIVHMADTADTALTLAGQESLDCVILDVNLGTASGFDLSSKLQESISAPILYLSTLSGSKEQETGFLTGGADYITKDVSPQLFWLKVEARIKVSACLRAELSSGKLRLDLKERLAFLRGQALPLTTVEFDLLHLLMQNAGIAYAPSKLYELIWGNRQWDDGHTVQLHLSQLCRKLESAETGHRFIESVWGEGYRFRSEP